MLAGAGDAAHRRQRHQLFALTWTLGVVWRQPGCLHRVDCFCFPPVIASRAPAHTPHAKPLESPRPRQTHHPDSCTRSRVTAVATSRVGHLGERRPAATLNPKVHRRPCQHEPSAGVRRALRRPGHTPCLALTSPLTPVLFLPLHHTHTPSLRIHVDQRSHDLTPPHTSSCQPHNSHTRPHMLRRLPHTSTHITHALVGIST